MAIVLGLDIGTTSTIGILIDHAGHTLALAKRPATLYSEQANFAEEDPAEWWKNVTEICRELLHQTGLPPDAIACVGVTGMLPAVVLVDAEGRAVRRAIQQNDARAIEELASFRSGMPEDEFLALTGTGYSQQLVGPKVMWLKSHESAGFLKARYIMGASDYITSRLTWTFQVEHNWALESGFVNLSTGQYDERLIAMANIDPRLLPAICKSEDIVGAVTADASTQTGLRPGIPVIAGCADHVASAFVCGAVNDGDLVIKFGGSADVLLASSKVIYDPRLFIDYHIVPGLFFSNGCMAAGGNLLNWIVQHFAGGELSSAGQAGLSPHAWLDELASTRETELLFLPYILGEKTPLMDPHARGTLIGLGLHHALPDIWRAALEGVVFGMRHHVETFAENRLAVERVFATDGGAASDLWLHIAANVLGKPVTRITRHPGSCLGAAFLAAKAIGAVSNWSDIAAYVESGRTFEPEPGVARVYDRKYALWRETYERLKTLYPKFTEAQLQP